MTTHLNFKRPPKNLLHKTLNKKNGIIGFGIEGQVLCTSFLTEGYEIILGSRNAWKEKLLKWKTANEKGMTGTFADTAKFADIIVLATRGSVTIDAIELADKNNFDGKVVLDTTNSIADAHRLMEYCNFLLLPTAR